MRIAIVSYHFTPSTMVAALRARGLAKYLARAGHKVTVVTAEQAAETSPEWELVVLPGRTASSRMREALGVSQHHTVVDALSANGPARALSGALKFARRVAGEVVFWPDEAAGWSRRVGRWLGDAASAGEIDAVISTSPPASTHLAPLAAELGDVAWVADYRDLWTAAHHYPYSPLRRAVDRHYDARIMREADAVTVATEGFAEVARAAFPGVEVRAVYNGFDPEMFSAPERVAHNAKLTLVHAGSLYSGRVDPRVFFEGVSRAVVSGRVPSERLRIDFYSPSEAWLLEAIAAHGVGDVVRVLGTRPRSEVIAAYSAADALLLLQWDTPGERAVLPAKTLEYLASRRFMLCVGSPAGGEVERLLTRTHAGTRARDADAVADALATLFAEFDRTGFVRWPGDEAALVGYTQAGMAAAMEEALEAAVSAARLRSERR